MAKFFSKIADVCQKENLLYTATIFHKGVEIILKDSYKLIQHPLRDFKKLFNLEEGKKEAIPYNFYTRENIILDRALISDVEKGFESTSQRDLFRTIVKEERENGCQNFFVDDLYIDHSRYYCYYHKMDCVTLMRGLLAFQRRIMEFTKETLGERVDILEFTTASRFADFYFQKRGCYKGVFEVQSNNRAFIQESVRGGICAVTRVFVWRKSHQGLLILT